MLKKEIGMKILIAGAMLLALSGCSAVKERASTANGYQVDCERQYPKFTEMVACLDKKISSNRFLSREPKPKLYLLTAKDLSSKVSGGSITEDQARLQLQTRYVEIGQIGAPTAVQQQNIINSSQQSNKCTTAGGPINYYCLYAQ